jgi:GSH-dependent disulfide-bond oxidoreductase
VIDLYGTASPNVLKITIMLEEMGLPYKGHLVRVMHNENREPAFLALNPIGKVPVLIDHDREGRQQPIYESGAILIYLAETYHSPLLPSSGPRRWEVLEWLMVQMSLAGPMLGQVNHFQLLPSEAGSYADKRYRDQARRVYSHVNDRLGLVPWLGGSDYSIADIAMYPWSAFLTRHGFNPEDFPNLIAWRDRIDSRPAVKRGVAAIDAMMLSRPDAMAPVSNEQLDRLFSRSEPGPTADMAGYLALGPMTTARA